MKKSNTKSFSTISEDQILYEDNHLFILNKKCGELVQGDKTGDIPLIDKAKAFIKDKYDKPGNVFMGLPHRIDRPTSGIVILCKTGKALSRMTELFRKKEIQKTYWALVKDEPKSNSNRLFNHLKKNPKQNKSYVVSSKDKDAKQAILSFTKLKSSERYHLLEINLETGRHHQIRTQLANIGSPIKGDLKYGYDRSNPDGGISLHARSVTFIHPIKKEPLSIEAPTPKDKLWQYFESL
jgi:23S rRNA pseudouridine1911/1915/1917 synthase